MHKVKQISDLDAFRIFNIECDQTKKSFSFPLTKPLWRIKKVKQKQTRHYIDRMIKPVGEPGSKERIISLTEFYTCERETNGDYYRADKVERMAGESAFSGNIVDQLSNYLSTKVLPE